MPNVMAVLPNIGGALCSTLQSLADAHCWYRAVTLPRRKTVEIIWGAPNYRTDLSRLWAKVHHIVETCGGDIAA